MDVNAPIFEELSKLPTWWQQILKDKDLYVNIRKDNRVHVYYKGAAVIGEMQYEATGFRCQIHEKYLGNEKSSYRLTTPDKIVKEIGIIKENIDKHKASKQNKPEGMSEKEKQWELYTQGKYLDTEYAYNYEKDKEGNSVKIRIDLVTITDDGLVEFVELKGISDDRLLNKDGSKPEVVDQVNSYNEFVGEHQKSILDYYKKVQVIMKKIGVNNPLVDHEINGVAPKVRLVIADYKEGTHSSVGKLNRMTQIAQQLSKYGIISNIEDLLCNMKG